MFVCLVYNICVFVWFIFFCGEGLLVVFLLFEACFAQWMMVLNEPFLQLCLTVSGGVLHEKTGKNPINKYISTWVVPRPCSWWKIVF